MTEGSCKTAIEMDQKISAREEGPKFRNPSKGGLDRLIRIYGHCMCLPLSTRGRKRKRHTVRFSSTLQGSGDVEWGIR